jgi:hypothetical protein
MTTNQVDGSLVNLAQGSPRFPGSQAVFIIADIENTEHAVFDRPVTSQPTLSPFSQSFYPSTAKDPGVLLYIRCGRSIAWSPLSVNSAPPGHRRPVRLLFQVRAKLSTRYSPKLPALKAPLSLVNLQHSWPRQSRGQLHNCKPSVMFVDLIKRFQFFATIPEKDRFGYAKRSFSFAHTMGAATQAQRDLESLAILLGSRRVVRLQDLSLHYRPSGANEPVVSLWETGNVLVCPLSPRPTRDSAT